jgi:cytochrome c oxidase subunit 3
MNGESDQLAVYRYKTGTNRLGLWLFLVSDAFVFAALLISRFYLFGGVRPDLSQGLGLAVTSILLLSSFFMNRAESAISTGDQKMFLRGTLATIVLGVLFLVGVIGVEWPTAPFSASDNAMASMFYTMTGFHAFHVLSGVVLLVIIYLKGRRGYYSADRHWGVEATAVYWHFVDVVWVFFYPALYLAGILAG